ISIDSWFTSVNIAGYGHRRSNSIAGSQMVENLGMYLQTKHQVQISPSMASVLISRLGFEDQTTMQVQGRNLNSGLPATITISSDEVREAIEPIIQSIIRDLVANLPHSFPNEMRAA